MISLRNRNVRKKGTFFIFTVVKGWALVCYWCVRELGMSMTEVADHLKIAVPTVSVAVRNGGKIVAEESLILSELLNIKI